MRIMKCYLQMVFVATVLGVAALGCGNNYQLKGKITYEDGTPIPVGMVHFDSGTSLSRGRIQSDGSYTVGTLKNTDGIPKGTYKVYITGAEVAMETDTRVQRMDAMGNPMPTMAGYRQLVDRQYMNASTTPITCVVPVEKNRFDFTVEPPVY
ncbi:MAG: hypothetical protein FWD31_04050 [Planctomycetaceae bacterium]|nr:hypothetical protein [Planctomycetaceae bacterium]